MIKLRSLVNAWTLPFWMVISFFFGYGSLFRKSCIPLDEAEDMFWQESWMCGVVDDYFGDGESELKISSFL